MTENKRFYKQKSTIEDYMIYDDDKEDAYFISCKDESDADYLVVLLNNLNNENEQLKSIIDKLTLDNTKMKKVLNTTKNENEHIKNTIKEAYNNERTELGKSVLKQLMETIQ